MPDTLAEIESALVAHVSEHQNTHADDLLGVMQAVNVPGLSFVTFKHGEIDAVGTYGLLNAADTREVRPDTLFQAASNSKSITALLCLRLVEAGILDLDTDVNTYLKSWQVPAVEGWQPQVTLRQLLSHTAATTVHGFWGYAADKPLPSVPQILSGEAPANSPALVVDGLSGHSGRYSGGGTTIVQLVMMDITGKSFPELAQEWVIDPLEMTDSAFMQPPPPEKQARAAYAHLYTGHPLIGNWHVYPELAAAGLWTTPTDMSKFARAIQAGKRGEHPIISQEVVEWMLTPIIENGEVTHALGVFLRGEGDDIIFGHGGGNVGFRCLYNAYADGRGGYSIMTNGDQGWLFFEAMREILPKLYGGNDEIKKASDLKIDFKNYLGDYKNEDLLASITQEGEILFLKWNGQSALRIEPKSKDEFSIVGLKSSFKVERDEEGIITALNFIQSGTSRKLKRILERQS